MNRSKFINITLVLFGVLFSIFIFLFVDYIYSNYFSKNLKAQEYKLQKDNGFYELKKDSNLLARWGDYLYKVKTDENGFRIDESVDSNESVKAKYIFLGDSFTFGVHNIYSETFVGMFDKYTNGKALNAGVPSYSPSGYLYEYKRALGLDVLESKHNVIVGIDISDVQDEASYWQDGINHPVNNRSAMRTEYFKKNPVDKDYFKEFRRKNFKLARRASRFVRDSIRGIRGWNETQSAIDAFDTNRSAFTWKDWGLLNKHDNKSFLDHSSYYPLGVQGGLDRIKSKIQSIALLAKKNNSNLYLLIYPWPAQIKYKQKFDWSTYVDSICHEVKCSSVINAHKRFMDYAKSNDELWYKDLYIHGDTHYNVNGNKLVYNELLKNLVLSK